MLECVEILKIIYILTWIEPILSSLKVFVLLLKFVVGALMILGLVLRHLELYPESLTFHFLILPFFVLMVVLLTVSFAMVYVDIAFF